jgi:hypothetical protein
MAGKAGLDSTPSPSFFARDAMTPPLGHFDGLYEYRTLAARRGIGRNDSHRLGDLCR